MWQAPKAHKVFQEPTSHPISSPCLLENLSIRTLVATEYHMFSFDEIFATLSCETVKIVNPIVATSAKIDFLQAAHLKATIMSNVSIPAQSRESRVLSDPIEMTSPCERRVSTQSARSSEVTNVARVLTTTMVEKPLLGRCICSLRIQSICAVAAFGYV